MKKKYYAGIELYRILITFWIAFVFHYGILYGAYPYAKWLQFFYSYGDYGVECFFAISGFVMYFAYYQRIRNGKVPLGEYCWNRVIRIWPVMILTVVAAALGQWLSIGLYGHAAALDVGDSRNTLLAFLVALIGCQCGWFSNHDSMAINGPTWYISIVMVCYMIYYIILRVAKKSKAREILLLGFMLVLGIYLYLNPLNVPLLYQSSGRGYLSFFLGVFVAMALERIELKKKRLPCLICGFMGVLLWAVMFKLNNMGNIQLTAALLLSPALLCIFSVSHLVEKLSDNGVIRYMGGLSFDVYLWNVPIAIWVHLIIEMSGVTIDFSDGRVFILHMLGNLVIAACTYSLFEKKAVKALKERFACAENK